MKTFRTIAACVAALTLAACGPTAAPQAEATQASASTEAAKPEISAASAPATQTPVLQLVGRWGDNGDCTRDIVFGADGSFRSYTGGSGTWRLDGDVVTMSGQGGTFQVRVEIINDTQLVVHNPDGSVGTSQRC